MTSLDDIFVDDLNYIHFSALKGGVYHSMRSDFFSRCRFWSATFVFVVGLSSIIFGGSIVSLDVLAIWLSCLAFFISFLSFAVNFTEKNLLHKMLSDRWKDLVRKIDDKSSEEYGIQKEDYNLFVREYNLIFRDEPIMRKGLDAIAYNYASSMNYDNADLIPISWHVSWFSNLYSFNLKDFVPVSQSESKKSDSKGK